MTKIPSLAEELLQCERDYIAFLLKYSAGDLRECSALSKVSEAAFSGLLKKHGLGDRQRAQNPAPKITKLGTIKQVCAKSALSAAEIHKAVGGSYKCLSVYLSQMKARGDLVVSGNSGSFRYRAA